MKKLLAIICLLPLLAGCSRENRALSQGIALREKLLNSPGCSFSCRITADYGDAIHKFSLACQADSRGNLRFQVTEPETIAGIAGKIREDGGRLTFGDRALHFDLLTDDQLSPVCGPWIFLRTLRGGYLLNGGVEGEKLHLQAQDSYEADALHVDLWLLEDGTPETCEILYRNRKILTLEIGDFLLSAGQPSEPAGTPEIPK